MLKKTKGLIEEIKSQLSNPFRLKVRAPKSSDLLNYIQICSNYWKNGNKQKEREYFLCPKTVVALQQCIFSLAMSVVVVGPCCKTKSEPPFVTFQAQIDNCGERLTGHCSRNYLRKSAQIQTKRRQMFLTDQLYIWEVENFVKTFDLTMTPNCSQ